MVVQRTPLKQPMKGKAPVINFPSQSNQDDLCYLVEDVDKRDVLFSVQCW